MINIVFTVISKVLICSLLFAIVWLCWMFLDEMEKDRGKEVNNMYYQIRYKRKDGDSWVADPYKYEHGSEAYADAAYAKKHNGTIEKIEVVCVEED